MDLSVIVISLNSRAFLHECLQSLDGATWRDVSYEAIVVDNASTDGTVEMLARLHPHVRVVANATNVGFCRAGNQGAAVARGRYLLFLNDDTVILDDALARIVEWLDRHPEAGMSGPRLLNTDGTDQFSSGRRFTTPMAAVFGRKSVLTRWFPRARWATSYLMSDRVESSAPYEVDWLSAAAMAVRRDVFDRVGGLAEDFYYFHEQVFCARVKAAGRSIFLDPTARLIHHEGVGSGVRTRRVRRRHILSFHSAAARWFCLHHGLGPAHPLRPVVAVALWCRAALLIAADTIRPDRARVGAQVTAGRPEGGVAL